MQLSILVNPAARPQRRLPPWLKRPLPAGDFSRTVDVVAESGVATVCQEARCPNLSECWSKRHATFMILGDKCTRRCHYCAVETARPDPPAEDEPDRLAEAVARLNLAHVVITAVARDDLKDQGAGHFARCVRALHGRCPGTTVEVLPADFHARRDCIETLCAVGPELYNHNLEMVERLTPFFRPQGKYRRSLEVLRIVKEITAATRAHRHEGTEGNVETSKRRNVETQAGSFVGSSRSLPFTQSVKGGSVAASSNRQSTIDNRQSVSTFRRFDVSTFPPILTKSGLMVGLGETVDELHRAFEDLREVGCDVLTLGQYLQPTREHHAPVARYYHPDEFAALAEYARILGFVSVAAGPFVRSSYNAAEVFEESRRRLSKSRL